MAKGNTRRQNQKLTAAQRRVRIYQILFSAIAVIVLISMLLSLVAK